MSDHKPTCASLCTAAGSSGCPHVPPHDCDCGAQSTTPESGGAGDAHVHDFANSMPDEDVGTVYQCSVCGCWESAVWVVRHLQARIASPPPVSISFPCARCGKPGEPMGDGKFGCRCLPGVRPDCTCAAIQAADGTRHFRECPLRAENPEGPGVPVPTYLKSQLTPDELASLGVPVCARCGQPGESMADGTFGCRCLPGVREPPASTPLSDVRSSTRSAGKSGGSEPPSEARSSTHESATSTSPSPDGKGLASELRAKYRPGAASNHLLTSARATADRAAAGGMFRIEPPSIDAVMGAPVVESPSLSAVRTLLTDAVLKELEDATRAFRMRIGNLDSAVPYMRFRRAVETVNAEHEASVRENAAEVLSAVRARADGAPERMTLVLVDPKRGEDAMALDSPTWGRQFPRVDYVPASVLDAARSENARLERELAEANHYLKRTYSDLTNMNGELTEARAEVGRLSTALDDIRRSDQGVTFVVDGEKGLHVRGPQEAVDALEMRIATARDEVERLKAYQKQFDELRAGLTWDGKLPVGRAPAILDGRLTERDKIDAKAEIERLRAYGEERQRMVEHWVRALKQALTERDERQKEIERLRERESEILRFCDGLTSRMAVNPLTDVEALADGIRKLLDEGGGQ